MSKAYIKSTVCAAALAISGGTAFAATLGVDATAYALGNDGKSLVTVATANNAAPSALSLNFTGGDGNSLDALAYRPQTTQLYGYDNKSDSVYLIDAMTGSADLVVSNPGITNQRRLGFDFNNQLDAARIVTVADENVVFFPNRMPPELVAFTPLAYPKGDVNESAPATIEMNAYTNAVPDAESTEQFAIDTRQDTLVKLANNAGTLTTIASLILDGNPFDVDSAGGFDILSFRDESNSISNQAFALLTDAVTSLQAIYSIGLTEDDAGMMKFVSDVPTQYGSLTGFAVAPTPSAVPLPASLPLLAGAVMGFAALRRRTNRKA